MHKKAVLVAATCLATFGLSTPTWASASGLSGSPNGTLAQSPANDEGNLLEMLGLSEDSDSDCPDHDREGDNEGLLGFLNFGSDDSKECDKSNESPSENH